MNRTLYSGLWWLAMPAVLGRLWWRGRKEPGYREHWGERLALAASLPNAKVLPRLSMDEAVTLARNAALAIGVDTGLTHIAAAFVRPTIEIYCDSPKWKTEGNWSDRIVNLGDLGAPPSVPEVIAAARSLLEAQ